MTGYFILGAIFALIHAFVSFVVLVRMSDRPSDDGEFIISAAFLGVVSFFFWPIASPIGLALVLGLWYTGRLRRNDRPPQH